METSDPSELTSANGQYMVPDVPDIFCDPCSEDGNHLQAEGYCVDCEHYLCNICFQHHLRPKPCRNHQLLDKKKMPLVKPGTIYKDECTDTCGTHKDEFLKYFCENHEVLGCTVCMTQRHRACTVGFIPNMSDNLFESLEYRTFKADVESLTDTIRTIKDAVTRNFNDIKTYAVKAMGEVRKFRKEVDSVFDQLEKNISEKILQTQIEDKERIQAISEQCDRLEVKIEKVHKRN